MKEEWLPTEWRDLEEGDCIRVRENGPIYLVALKLEKVVQITRDTGARNVPFTSSTLCFVRTVLNGKPTAAGRRSGESISALEALLQKELQAEMLCAEPKGKGFLPWLFPKTYGGPNRIKDLASHLFHFHAVYVGDPSVRGSGFASGKALFESLWETHKEDHRIMGTVPRRGARVSHIHNDTKWRQIRES